ncbi:hypothetical protein CVIRNUC_008365 [Coccomyxa viridis]|uniref:Glycoside hydrolase family 2 protein n=1 Tax=Coccomyxa viridis TaxID=1274662 RepID=A0AAV1ICS7_9CHLO|nr:hypothetical protein CVIRNUC_008365 [Coccomyxa viridis]
MQALPASFALTVLVWSSHVVLSVVSQALYTQLSPPQAFAQSLLQSPSADCICNPSWQATVGNCTRLQLATPWSCKVDPANPWPQYPRPQMKRPDWMNLNGKWQWQSYDTWQTNPPPFNVTLERSIIVPYPVQSDLSGVPPPFNMGVLRMFYRRTFSLPQNWTAARSASRVLMHFDAVNWEAEVWVNQQRAGMHQGGYDRFTFDITDALAAGTGNVHEVIVRVFSPLDSAHIPLGKQRLHVPSKSIFYSASSGIWQTVWLEQVPSQYITGLSMIPDLDHSRLAITVNTNPTAANLTAQVQVLSNGTQVALTVGPVGKLFGVTIPNCHLWSPADPFLYDVIVNLTSTAPLPLQSTAFFAISTETPTAIDTVHAYTGMRKISLDRTTPTSPLRIFLNNNATLQVGLLDQGFWPDGIYTAATEEALLYDMRVAHALGFTTLRKHIKVEPDHYYHAADKLGMLIWQDMPSMYWEDPYSGLIGDSWRSSDEKAQFRLELQRMVTWHISFPSIIYWTLFNEGWGQFDTVDTIRWASKLDPSRLWDAASGWVDPADPTSSPSTSNHGNATGYIGDIRSDHNYPAAMSSGATASRASVCSEFGGLGLFTAGHTWVAADWQIFTVYPLTSDAQALQDQLLQLMDGLPKLFNSTKGLSAAIYTQISDVEAEVNGVMTYDRKIFKLPQPQQVRQKILSILSTPV